MMPFSLFKDLAGRRFPEILQITPTTKSFYGDMYNATYNQTPALYREELAEFVEKYGLKTSLECFGGNAFESSLLVTDTKIKATSVDIDTYFEAERFDNVDYIWGDCFDQEMAKGGPYDLIFVGGTNASMEGIHNVQNLRSFFRYARTALTEDGKFIGSFFPDREAESEDGWDMWDLTKSTHEPQFGNKWVGCTVDWYQITHFDLLMQIHTYYNLVKIYRKEVPNSGEWWYNDKGYRSKAWALHEVLWVAKEEGFEFLEEDYKFDTRFCPFKKVD